MFACRTHCISTFSSPPHCKPDSFPDEASPPTLYFHQHWQSQPYSRPSLIRQSFRPPPIRTVRSRHNRPRRTWSCYQRQDPRRRRDRGQRRTVPPEEPSQPCCWSPCETLARTLPERPLGCRRHRRYWRGTIDGCCLDWMKGRGGRGGGEGGGAWGEDLCRSFQGVLGGEVWREEDCWRTWSHCWKNCSV